MKLAIIFRYDRKFLYYPRFSLEKVPYSLENSFFNRVVCRGNSSYFEGDKHRNRGHSLTSSFVDFDPYSSGPDQLHPP